MTDRVLIIGGGHAAGQCAASLRQKGWTGDIVIAGEEPVPPYQRPPLSKAYLAGELSAERLFVRPAEFYARENIDLKPGWRATMLDRAIRKVHFENGEIIDYAYLVLATGARVRRLTLQGSNLDGVGYVRSIADVDVLQARLHAGVRLAVVGAGYIGLEVAAVAAKRGLNVTVLEAADRVMARVTSPVISEFFQDLHRSHGVDIRLGVGVEGFVGETSVAGVTVAGGGTLDCDFAIVGIGVIPNAELAEMSGLAVDDGVLVNEHARTADTHVYAIGDCTRHPSRYFGKYLRLESVHNALEQAKTAASAICGEHIAYDQVPWFWSDQYDVKLQTAGVCAGRDDQQAMRGDPAEKSFSVFYLSSGKIIAVDSVNAPADHMISRRLIAAGVTADPKALADKSFDLKSLL